VRVAEDEGHVRHRVDEGAGLAQLALGHEGGPELAGELELLVDAERLLRAHGPVGGLGRVVELAERGVAGAGVVPDVGALRAHLVEALEHRDVPLRLELLEEHAEGGAHDASADQEDVGRFRCLR
jgi:hypothetical protein